MSGENEDKTVVTFDFEGQMEATDVRGFDYKNIFLRLSLLMICQNAWKTESKSKKNPQK